MSKHLDEFLKSKLKKGFESGLFAVRNAVAPCVYNDEMVERTEKRVSKSLYTMFGVAGFSLALVTPFPKSESFKILEGVTKLGQITFGTASGFAFGVAGTSISNKIIDGQWKDGSGNKDISLKGLVQKIDKYLSEKRPDLYEKSKLIVDNKVNEVIASDIQKEKVKKEKELLLSAKIQEKEFKKQQKMAENKNILEMQQKKRAERK